jgi:hypothetical protein
MSERTARELAEEYFAAWKAKDFERFRAVIADDCGIQQLSKSVTDIVIAKMFVDGDDVATWFDLHTQNAPPCPTVNWSHIENGSSDASQRVRSIAGSGSLGYRAGWVRRSRIHLRRKRSNECDA